MHSLPGLSRPGVPRLGQLFRLPRLASPRPDTASPDSPPDFALGSSRNKSGKIAVIVGIHVLAFWGLQNGMVRDAVKRLPQIVDVTFVAPPEQAPPAPPKTVEVALKTPPVITPPLPQLPIVIENTITVPPAPPKPVEAAPAVPSAPSAPAAVAAPPAQPAAPRLVTGVEYLRMPQPVYPSISRRLGETGIVTLRVLVSEKGVPEQATVQQSSGSTNLDEAGRQAALRSLFKPYMEDGKPVAVYVLVPINFKLS